jgi:hypothetical protein
MEVQSSTKINSQSSAGLTSSKVSGTNATSSDDFDGLLLKALSRLFKSGSSASLAKEDKENIASTAEESADQETASTAADESTDSTVLSSDPLTADDGTAAVDDASTTTDSAEEFSISMLTAMVGATQITEEQLYMAILGQKLNEVKPEAATFFNAEAKKVIEQQKVEGPFVCEEEASKAALQATVAAGLIDQTTAEQINGVAFAAAQLDDNLEQLFDGMGSEGDPTIAICDIETAYGKSKAALDKMAKGELSTAARALDQPPDTIPSAEIEEFGESEEGEESEESSSEAVSESTASSRSGAQNVDGPGGFLWKPESITDGNLGVLFPSSMAGTIDRVEIHSSLPATEETKIEEGAYSGQEPDSGRPLYRFSQPGEEYGQNVQVVAFNYGGDTATWEIDDGAERHD